MPNLRETIALRLMAVAGLPVPRALSFAQHSIGISAEFMVDGALEAFEGCGANDAAAVADLVGHFRGLHP